MNSRPGPARVIAQWVIRTVCRRLVARHVDLTVTGAEHVPTAGPALIAARHVHHLYDGCALVATSHRPPHLLVALDWTQTPRGRWLMELACGQAGWPVVLRADALGRPAGGSAFRAIETRRYLRRAVGQAVDLLRAGHLLVVFPEGYPNIDPTYTPKTDTLSALPFQPGFARLADLAARDGRTRVPIVPAGLAYTAGARWRIRLSFDRPVYADDFPHRADLVAAIEARVLALSRADVSDLAPRRREVAHS